MLRERGVHFAGPAEGRMASGLKGLGRMLEPAEVLGEIRVVLGRETGALAGKKVVVSAGGTQEDIDPVRFITNRSSGKQGYAVAQAAIDAGADVTLISTPTALTYPVGAKIIPVRSAEQMLEAVLAESADADALIMAAAVADFRSTDVAEKKLKKRDGIPQIMLETAPDILGTIANLTSSASRPQVVVGFAAESRDLLANATEKMLSKKLDMIVANDISANDAGFDVDENRVTLLLPDGRQEKLSLRSKFAVAEKIILEIASMLEN
jgi:phosphopantothenoylcysteine decarboxylase/phosphopantothenate--cysteine ligase